MEDIAFERDGLPVRLDAAALQLMNVCNTLKMVHELLEQHHGSWVASDVELETFLSFLVLPCCLWGYSLRK